MRIKKLPVGKTKVLSPKRKALNKKNVQNLLGVIHLEQGKLVLFYTRSPFTISAVLICHKNSNDVLWRSSKPFWEGGSDIEPKTVELHKQQISIKYLSKKKIQKVTFPLTQVFEIPRVKKTPAVFDRIAVNPMLTPKCANQWESLAVFNAATLYLDGRVHFVYRAIGESGLSNFGYATSSDGEHIDRRFHEPIYYDSDLTNSDLTDSDPSNGELSEINLTENNPSENSLSEQKVSDPLSYSQHYQSGINWGGYEDPRLTQVDDTIYMTYTAFDGYNPPGVALTSISKNNFLKENWLWKKPVLISAPQQAHKNWVIFPQKIKGKFAVMHSITPEVLIDYYEDLEFENDSYIESRYQSSGRENRWDNCMRGVGPPPIKTAYGWLVLYHAMDKRDPDRYKIGAMLLDLDEPTKIIYRSSNPLLEPDARYENDGFKSGVVYTCGAVIIGEKLYVYYGGADTVVCAAFINLEQLLDQLRNENRPILSNVFVASPARKKAKLCMGRH